MHSKRIQEKIKADYDAIAEEFDETRQFPWKEFEVFLPFYNRESAVLDLGCGNGRLLTFLKKHGYKKYLGVDQSKKLLALAQAKFPQEKFLLADISRLPAFEEKFDAIFAIASFHHLPPKEHFNILKAWKETLKPGGRLFMTNWNLFQWRFVNLWLKTLFWPRYGFSALQIPWKQRIHRTYFACTLRGLSRALNKAGFKVIYQEKGQNFVHIAEA